MNIPRVLIIDDDYGSAHLIKTLLQRRHIGCRIALSLPEAKDILLNEFNLVMVFQEVSMPCPIHFSFTDWINRVKSRDIGLVAVSSLDKDEIYNYYGKCIFDMIIQKPVHFNEIYEAVHYAGVSMLNQEYDQLSLQAS